jgi:hypothetical protein
MALLATRVGPVLEATPAQHPFLGLADQHHTLAALAFRAGQERPSDILLAFTPGEGHHR